MSKLCGREQLDLPAVHADGTHRVSGGGKGSAGKGKQRRGDAGKAVVHRLDGEAGKGPLP